MPKSRLLLLACLALLSGACSHAAQPPATPVPSRTPDGSLTSKQALIDLGPLYAGEERKFEVTFANRGPKALALQPAQGSCGCTQIKDSPKTIAAGSEATVRGNFRSLGYKGKVSKELYVSAQAPEIAMVSWEIQADVQPYVKMDYAVNLTTTPAGSTVRGSVPIECILPSDSTTMMKIDKVESSHPSLLRVLDWPKEGLKPGQKGEIQYEFHPTKEGRTVAAIFIHLSQPAPLKLEFDVHTFVVPARK